MAHPRKKVAGASRSILPNSPVRHRRAARRGWHRSQSHESVDSRGVGARALRILERALSETCKAEGRARVRRPPVRGPTQELLPNAAEPGAASVVEGIR